MVWNEDRPPSIDRIARSLADTGLPHELLVEIARSAVADHEVESARSRAVAYQRSMLTRVVNATGVLLHTNLGRAQVRHHQEAAPSTVEFDLESGARGPRGRAVGRLFAQLCGAEDAIVVNNNAAAVLLVAAAMAGGRDVLVSRGEAVEIGGGFRVPEVLAQSGARLIDVGTTNRTRLSDYTRAVHEEGADVAMVLKVHPSNYSIVGFVESTSVLDLATLDVPVIVDIGSGLLDSTTPWLQAPPPKWLAGEPAARQSLADGASLVTFSGDKLLGGPQAGIIAGRTDLVAKCKAHPLYRAVRCGPMVMSALQDLALVYLQRTVRFDVPFWRMALTPTDELRNRAQHVVAQASFGAIVDSEAVPGAGSVPGVSIPSAAIALCGDRLRALRECDPPIIARMHEDRTLLDLRSVDQADDPAIVSALQRLAATPES